jgi:hypothetical protein
MLFYVTKHPFNPEATQSASALPSGQSRERASLRGFDQALAGRCAR